MEKTAEVIHIVTDMGNGAAFCGGCMHLLGSDPAAVYETCETCGAILNGSSMSVNHGGSDF